MRQVFIDSEATGESVDDGHRLVEIACVEVVDGLRTGRYLHHYINPERDVDPGAEEFHGLSRDFLADKPTFGQISHELMEFVQGAELVAHNAPRDVSFLNNEFRLLGKTPLFNGSRAFVDTLEMARSLYPGKSCSMDSLCRYLNIGYSPLPTKGALLDAEILSDIYFGMVESNFDPNADGWKELSVSDIEIAISFPFGEPSGDTALRIYQETMKELFDDQREDHLVHFGFGDPHLYVIGVDQILQEIPNINDTSYWYPKLELRRNGHNITPMREMSWIFKLLEPKAHLEGFDQRYEHADGMKELTCQLDRLAVKMWCNLVYYRFG
jgi:DNA polymerase-3 subunit epsilon